MHATLQLGKEQIKIIIDISFSIAHSVSLSRHKACMFYVRNFQADA